jgi:diguanylate cyclase (GGDEF)-like protein
VAGAIQATLRRAGDFVARYGGEEFAVVLPYTGAEDALTVGRMILEQVDRLGIPHSSSPVARHVTLSIGAATIHFDQPVQLADFIRLSDNALYEAKNSGRHCVRCA